jgi:hypothetical protein
MATNGISLLFSAGICFLATPPFGSPQKPALSAALLLLALLRAAFEHF